MTADAQPASTHERLETPRAAALAAGSVTLALSLVPFAGIAFLWFMGVVRDCIGFREDQFLSTVFYGSGCCPGDDLRVRSARGRSAGDARRRSRPADRQRCGSS